MLVLQYSVYFKMWRYWLRYWLAARFDDHRGVVIDGGSFVHQTLPVRQYLLDLLSISQSPSLQVLSFQKVDSLLLLSFILGPLTTTNFGMKDHILHMCEGLCGPVRRKRPSVEMSSHTSGLEFSFFLLFLKLLIDL